MQLKPTSSLIPYTASLLSLLPYLFLLALQDSPCSRPQTEIAARILKLEARRSADDSPYQGLVAISDSSSWRPSHTAFVESEFEQYREILSETVGNFRSWVCR